METANGFPLLTAITFLPLAGVVVLGLLRHESAIRWTSLLVTAVTAAAVVPLCSGFDKSTYAMQFVERHSWIGVWGIEYTVGVDGISLLFVALAALLSILGVGVSWRAIRTNVREFHAALLILETAMIGVFVVCFTPVPIVIT